MTSYNEMPKRFISDKIKPLELYKDYILADNGLIFEIRRLPSTTIISEEILPIFKYNWRVSLSNIIIKSNAKCKSFIREVDEIKEIRIAGRIFQKGRITNYCYSNHPGVTIDFHCKEIHFLNTRSTTNNFSGN